MEDGEKNSKIFNVYLRNLSVHVEGLFKNYDKKSEGTMKVEDFQHALKKISTDKGLKLSENEIEIVCAEVSKDKSGNILYSDFLNGFRHGIPEFLKPKTLRRSQSGHPWTWTVADKKK
jgi:Ca2+-binding EF-hand superfamily protein